VQVGDRAKDSKIKDGSEVDKERLSPLTGEYLSTSR
jgi:hypothetical protein